MPQNVSLQDLEDLQADIKVYKDLDKNKTEQTFWEDMEVVCEDQIKQKKKKIKVSRVIKFLCSDNFSENVTNLRVCTSIMYLQFLIIVQVCSL